jgi:hypothetical protein
MDWKKLLLAAGGAAGVCAVLYYLLKEESAVKSLLNDLVDEDGKRELKKHSVDEITKEQVEKILQEIIKSQEQMKGYMKELTVELLSKSLTFEQTYQRVKDVQPSDPLDKYGLSMTDFDQLLDKHQSDQKVRDAIAKIMGAPSPSSISSEKVQAITVKQIIEVHTFMLQELDKLVGHFQTLPNKESFDMKTVTIAAQAIVGSKIEQSFGITSEDIESAVLMYHTMLATDQEFAAINVKIQHAMGKLMGTPFTTS